MLKCSLGPHASSPWCLPPSSLRTFPRPPPSLPLSLAPPPSLLSPSSPRAWSSFPSFTLFSFADNTLSPPPNLLTYLARYPEKPSEGMVVIDLAPSPMADPSYEPNRSPRLLPPPPPRFPSHLRSSLPPSLLTSSLTLLALLLLAGGTKTSGKRALCCSARSFEAAPSMLKLSASSTVRSPRRLPRRSQRTRSRYVGIGYSEEREGL
eukprot:3414222-Rhodomonas_salina.1